MNSIYYTDHGLNVKYVPDFIGKGPADAYFAQLQTLPFYTPTLKIRGKEIKPNRLVLAYGDDSLSYTFSGTSIAAEPWSPLLLELRNQVETYVGCTYNYVLLNLYPDGSSSISQHKDDESSIDDTFPIAVLSFGAERTIEFKKPKSSSTAVKLQHGSLYCMSKPTNRLFTHGIAAEPHVKGVRISLTFRHMISQPVFRVLKKPRLDSVPDNTLPAQVPDPSPKDILTSPPNILKDCTLEPLPSNFSICVPQTTSDVLTNDWLSDLFQDEKKVNPMIAQWDLSQNTFLQIIMHANVRIHIRQFKETPSGQLLPTREGISMTPETFCFLQSKLESLKFHSVDESTIINNQLLAAVINEDIAIFQQMFPLKPYGFHLKPSFLRMFKFQVQKLLELFSDISDSLIHVIFTMHLPDLISNQKCASPSHTTSLEDAKFEFFNCLCVEIKRCAEYVLSCLACITMDSNQNAHECVDSLSQRFSLKTNQQKILLCLNIYKVIEHLRKSCMCHYDMLFFKEHCDVKFLQNLKAHLFKNFNKSVI